MERDYKHATYRQSNNSSTRSQLYYSILLESTREAACSCQCDCKGSGLLGHKQIVCSERFPEAEFVFLLTWMFSKGSRSGDKSASAHRDGKSSAMRLRGTY